MALQSHRNAPCRTLLALLVALVVGCTQRPPFMENADPALRKSSAQFAADSAKRRYQADAPRAGEATGRVEVDYGLHRINIVNSSPDDWNDVEIWVNQKYVVFVPRIRGKAAEAEIINFQSFYDQDGNYFPILNSQEVATVEMLKDGKMHSLGRPRLAD